MSVNKHTPGPWTCHQPHHRGLVSGIVRDKHNRFVCTTASPDTGEYNRDHNEIDANARLISLAPSLIAENKRLREALVYMLKNFDSEKNNAEAIAKAHQALKK